MGPFAFIQLAFLLAASVGLADVRVGNVTVPEQPGRKEGIFVRPNEHDFWRFAPALQGRKGALISVGTFRSLSDVGQGDFGLAVLFDFDDGVTRFNRRNLEILQKSPTRLDYLDRILGLRLSAEEKARWQASPELERRELLARLLELAKRPMDAKTPEWMYTTGPKYQTHADAYHSIADFLVNAEGPKAWTSTYLGSDANFAKVKRLAEAGKIIPISGNLAGTEGIDALSKALRSSGTPLSVLDVSNAMEAIQGADAERFLRNLRKLPWTADGKVLFTSKNFGGPSNWQHYAVPVQDFLKAAEKHPLSRLDEVFLESRYHLSPDLQPDSLCLKDQIRFLTR